MDQKTAGNTTRKPFMRPVSKCEFAGVGCVVQGLALIVIWFFPIGTLLGIGLIILGSIMSKKWICPQCKNPLASKDVKVCPACQASFQR